MPYIKPERRPAMDNAECPVTAGELNYILTRDVEAFLEEATGEVGVPMPTYAMINAAIGALECCKLELYRRLAAPYETVKMHENGDIPMYDKASTAYYRSLHGGI